jgi:hypothetical protein
MKLDEDGMNDEGMDEAVAYGAARFKLLGHENDVEALWKAITAADRLLQRQQKMLPFVQVTASLGDGNLVVGTNDGDVISQPVPVQEMTLQAQKALGPL